MKSWELLATAIALASGAWGQFKNIFSWFRNLVLVTVWVDDYAVGPIAAYLGSGRNTSTERLFSASPNTWIKSIGRYTTIAWECMTGSSRTFWHGWRPIWYSRPKDSRSAAHPHSFTFIRRTIDWDNLLIKSLDAVDPSTGMNFKWKNIRHRVHYHFGKNLGSELAQQRAKNEGTSTDDLGATTTIYTWGGTGNRLLGWKPDDIGKPHKLATFSALSLSNELLAIVEELKRWMALKEWYAERSIPWKRGYLFQGEPGTGKTAFARATAEELDLPVHVFDLATMSNADLRECWGKMLKTSPCMVVLEDIDAVFHGRENVATGGGVFTSGGLTFDALLNCIDGVERTDGVLLIVTTNYPEQVDPALSHRPGRIDRIVDFKPLDFEGRLKLSQRIISDSEKAFKLAFIHDGMPASKFVEVCCRAALEGLYDQPTDGPYR